MTYREAVYFVLDAIKGFSDDYKFTEEHVAFLVDKYRGALIKAKYLNDPKKDIPQSNYQTLQRKMEPSTLQNSGEFHGAGYLKSTEKVPNILEWAGTKIYPSEIDPFFDSLITIVPPERFPFTGYNKYLRNIVYATVGPDNYLYLKYFRPEILYLGEINIYGIFENTIDIDNIEESLDSPVSIEEALIPDLLRAVIKDLTGITYKPEDTDNNAKDDLADIGKAKMLNPRTRYPNYE